MNDTTTAAEPDQIQTPQDSVAELNKTIKLLVFGCLGFIVLVCLVCAGVTALSGVALNQVFSQIATEFDDEFSRYSGDLAEYEDSLRDLSGTDERELEIFQDNDWPADIPEEIPVFTAGSFKEVKSADSSLSKVWLVSYSEVTEAEFIQYKQTLNNNGWEDLLDDNSVPDDGSFNVFAVRSDENTITGGLANGQLDLTITVQQ